MLSWFAAEATRLTQKHWKEKQEKVNKSLVCFCFFCRLLFCRFMSPKICWLIFKIKQLWILFGLMFLTLFWRLTARWAVRCELLLGSVLTHMWLVGGVFCPATHRQLLLETNEQQKPIKGLFLPPQMLCRQEANGCTWRILGKQKKHTKQRGRINYECRKCCIVGEISDPINVKTCEQTELSWKQENK